MASRLRKIGGAVLVIVVVAAGVLAFMLSHESDCVPGPELADGAMPMKAVVRRCYGPPEVLSVETIEKPVPQDHQVLVRVRAAAINPLDWHYMRGKPYLLRIEEGMGAPKDPRLGVDYAGTVEAVGNAVTRFRPGDEVFGGKFGALAEYVVVAEDRLIVNKPDNVSFEQAGSVHVAGITALQALRDRGQVRAGQKVLINGASGGVGTFAVQIAKALGAEVSGVCSTRNVELVRSLGATQVFDYTKEDFAESGQRFDVILDNVGNRSMSDIRRTLTPEGKYILVGGGGPDAGPWIGAFTGAIRAAAMSAFVDQQMGMFVSASTPEDMAVLRDLLQEGKVSPVIDRTYSLPQIADAVRYLEEGHARGKVVITFD